MKRPFPIVTLSTYDSLKRKSTSPINTCHHNSKNVTPSSNTKCLIPDNVSKDDYHPLFPSSAIDKKYTAIEIDCGPLYGLLPYCVWDCDNRTVAKIKG